MSRRDRCADTCSFGSSSQRYHATRCSSGAILSSRSVSDNIDPRPTRTRGMWRPSHLDEEWGDDQSAAEDWRSDEYLDDWPRESAGPEWRMFEQIAADEADLAAAVEELLKSL